jgi:hypothetical protein
MDPEKTLGSIAFMWMCEATEQDLQEEEIPDV